RRWNRQYTVRVRANFVKNLHCDSRTVRLICVRSYPHAFNGRSGSPTSAKLKFLGADARCNENNPKLFEFPVMKDGSAYPKNEPHGTTRTPARVVYLQDGNTLCDVMTHVIEDRTDHHGSGDFRVCDE